MADIDLAPYAKADGLKYVKKGFCFDEAHDQAFALGWPHIRFTVEEEADPYRTGLRLLREPSFDLRVVWPRKVASALVRAWGQGQLFDLAPGSREFRTAAQEALWNMRKLTEDDVHESIRTRMETDGRSTETFVLLLEALSSSEWVADAIVSHLETLMFDELHELNTHPALITYQLGFVLLRVEPKQAEAFRTRLRHVVEGNGNVHPRSDTRPKGHPSHIRSALLVLEGAQAADRYTDKDLRWYTHTLDDPDHVLMRCTINRRPTLPSARLVFLGGPDVLGTRTFQSWNKLSPRDQKWFFEQISPIRHPRVVELMLSGVQHGEAFGALAAGWFSQHAAYARPVLEDLAETAVVARDVLSRM